MPKMLVWIVASAAAWAGWVEKCRSGESVLAEGRAAIVLEHLQTGAKEAEVGRASDAQLAAVSDADSFRAIPLKAVEGSGTRIERLPVVLVAVEHSWEQDQEVTVHLVKGELVPLTVLLQAERTATLIYSGIGVKLRWSSAGKDKLSVQFDAGLREGFYPGALGYATPYAQMGTRIHVLVDRLHVLVTKPLGGALLGHVLAHELAHVLEGFTHHSEAGLMKARWDNGDLEQMTWRPLSFSAEDAAAIRSGLAKFLASSTGSPDLAERQ